MLCKKPTVFDYKNPNVAYPCGQCIQCRINRRRIWAHRIMLETLAHDSPSSFLTLTYDDSRLPVDCHHPRTGVSYADFSVQPQHLKAFMEGLRYRLGSQPRFYGVGEYGSKTQRPHYHIALFGYPPCTHGSPITNGIFQPCRCQSCLLLSKVWGKGHILNGSLSVDSAQYIAGYIEKKLVSDKCICKKFGHSDHHPACPSFILKNRFPEFSRMSRKPGVGSYGADKIAAALQNRLLLEKDDVPLSLVHGSKVLPLGRYLSDRVHNLMGHEYSPHEKTLTFEKNLRSLCNSHADRSSIAPFLGHSMAHALTFLGGQRILDLETKHRIFNKEKTL